MNIWLISFVIDGNEADKVALVENILRQDLTPLEEAEAFQRLKGKFKTVISGIKIPIC